MKTKTLLNRLKVNHACSWHELAKKLDITYGYICYLRRGNEAGKFLKEKIEDMYIKPLQCEFCGDPSCKNAECENYY